VEYLLARLKGELDKTGTKLLVVHIPRGNAFENGDALSRGKASPDRSSQGPLRKAEDSPCRSARGASGRHSLAAIYKEHYIHRPDGSIGHFTPQGNAEVAKIIAEALKAKGMLKKRRLIRRPLRGSDQWPVKKWSVKKNPLFSLRQKWERGGFFSLKRLGD